jgi:hypothetical protein
MKHETTAAFAGQQPARLPMMEAVGLAKAAVASMTVLDFDSIGACEKRADGGWTIAVDVIESVARMGDNDLLATYSVQIDAEGDLVNLTRTRRYHREDRDQS